MSHLILLCVYFIGVQLVRVGGYQSILTKFNQEKAKLQLSQPTFWIECSRISKETIGA